MLSAVNYGAGVVLDGVYRRACDVLGGVDDCAGVVLHGVCGVDGQVLDTSCRAGYCVRCMMDQV